MKMSSSISELCEDSGAAALPSVGPSPEAPKSTTAVPHLFNKREAFAITHKVDNLSSSLSFITLTILLSMQVPIIRGTHLENSDLSGTTRKMMSSSYPVILVTCTHSITKPSPHATQSNQVERVIHKVPQKQYRELVLVHITRCHSVHLTATVSQSIDLMPLDLETH